MPADSTQPEVAGDDLEAAIEALLAEIDATCTRFENPPSEDEDDELAEYTRAMASVRSAQPAAEPDAEPEPADDAGAEQALDEAVQAADELLAQAADDLLGSLESALEQTETASSGTEAAVEAEPEPEPEAESEPEPAPEPDAEQDPPLAAEPGDDILAAAVDELLADADARAPDGVDTESAAAEPEAEQEPESVPQPDPAAATPQPESAPDDAALADLDAAFDELLEGTFESASGEPVDTDGVDTKPDPSLMLDAQTPPAAPPASARTPEPAAAAAEPEPAPEPAPVASTPPTRGSAPKSSRRPRADGARHAALALLERIVVWARPRLADAGRAALRAAKPVGARVLLLLSKPLEGRPPSVRDSIGWVAVWTLFLAVCVWVFVLLRPAPTPPPPGPASGVVSAETP